MIAVQSVMLSLWDICLVVDLSNSLDNETDGETEPDSKRLNIFWVQSQEFKTQSLSIPG